MKLDNIGHFIAKQKICPEKAYQKKLIVSLFMNITKWNIEDPILNSRKEDNMTGNKLKKKCAGLI